MNVINVHGEKVKKINLHLCYTIREVLQTCGVPINSVRTQQTQRHINFISTKSDTGISKEKLLNLMSVWPCITDTII